MRLTALVAPILLLLVVAGVPAPAVAQTLPGVLGEHTTPAPDAATDPVKLLLQILEDEPARARLVEQLKAAGESASADEATNLGRRVADTFTEIGEGGVARLRQVGAALVHTPQALSGLNSDEVKIVVDAVRELFFVILASVATFLVLRQVAKPYYRRVGQTYAKRPPAERVLPFVALAAIDLAIVLAAWLAAILVSIRLAGGSDIGKTHTLYLAAFLSVALYRFLMRLALAPATPSLRLLKLSDWAARRLYWFASALVILLGYGFLLILPIVADSGFAESRSTAVLIWLIAIAYTTVIVLRYRRPVGEWLITQWDGYPHNPALDHEGGSVEVGLKSLIRPFALGWYWIALGWLLSLLVAVTTQLPEVVTDLMDASAKVALAVIAGLIASGLLGRVIQWGILLPQHVKQRVPLLEGRLNRHVPRMLLVLRVLILVAVVFYSFSVLDLVSARGLIESQLGLQLTGRVFSVALILFAAFCVWLALTSWVDYRLNPAYGRTTAREQTLLTLLRNAGTILILTLTLMFTLSEIGLNIGPLIASAGVVGLAIGFGAQRMVQDIITGIFIQFENAMNVGDVVSAGTITGAVERLTVRSVSLRDVAGVYHIIPFSSVDVVSNFTRDFSYRVIDMGIAYREDVGEARRAMYDAFEELRSDPEFGGFILGEMEWFGVESFGDNAVILRARIKTWPAQQWAVGRAYNEIVKRIFEERDISIPYPQRTLWFGEDRDGEAAALHVRVDSSPAVHQRGPEPDLGPEPYITPPSQDGPPDTD